MRHLLLGLLMALGFGACMNGSSPFGIPAGEFGKAPANYQEKIRAYVANNVPNGEGAQLDFYRAPVVSVHGYRAIFSMRTRGSADSQQMYADFRNDVVVSIGPYDPPNSPDGEAAATEGPSATKRP